MSAARQKMPVLIDQRGAPPAGKRPAHREVEMHSQGEVRRFSPGLMQIGYHARQIHHGGGAGHDPVEMGAEDARADAARAAKIVGIHDELARHRDLLYVLRTTPYAF
jgi:hypothetical protein